MARFIDVHSDMHELTHEQLRAAHRRDRELESKEQVHFIAAWADPQSGKVFCLSEAPDKRAVLRVHERAGHPTSEIYEVSLAVE